MVGGRLCCLGSPQPLKIRFGNSCLCNPCSSKCHGRTLSVFDEDNSIHCFGFGNALTHDQSVFSFYPDDRLCNGFEEALKRYREIVPHLRLAGPTSFAPIIEAAIRIVKQSGGQYHVLLIIADGQVTRSVDTDNGQLSTQEQNTVNEIVEASEYPLSIVLVGVGDGPWDMMRQFDDNIPARAFDNFQFVNFTEIMSKNVSQSRKETEFALASLMEIPSHYKATRDLQILGRRRGKMLEYWVAAEARCLIGLLFRQHLAMIIMLQGNNISAQTVSKQIAPEIVVLIPLQDLLLQKPRIHRMLNCVQSP